jgi:hypothetical protein
VPNDSDKQAEVVFDDPQFRALEEKFSQTMQGRRSIVATPMFQQLVRELAADGKLTDRETLLKSIKKVNESRGLGLGSDAQSVILEGVVFYFLIVRGYAILLLVGKFDLNRLRDPKGVAAFVDALKETEFPPHERERVARELRDVLAEVQGNVPSEHDVWMVTSYIGKKGAEALSDEQRAKGARKGGQATAKKMSKAERTERARKGGRTSAQTMTAEERSERARRAVAAREKKRSERR